MKKISILMMAVAAMTVVACSSNIAKYDVTGVNAPQDGAVVYLVDRILSAPIDSAVVAGGTFRMQGRAEKDAFLSVSFDDSWYFPLFNDGKPVRIDLADSTLTGSPLNTKLSEWDKKDTGAYAQYRSFIDDYLSLPEAEQQAREEEFI
ncbi:MAG: DUF4369 domain-containing protein, partial [Bacteroidales bacterium]|nr:DUF4369 domain-containing protein [Bacteroidales bacterium]